MFTKENLLKLGISAAILYGAYKFAPSPLVKTAVLGVAGAVIVKNTPVLNQYVAI